MFWFWLWMALTAGVMITSQISINRLAQIVGVSVGVGAEAEVSRRCKKGSPNFDEP
jgi:uncharacterized membrane protein YdcZ (DUF606 family)